MNILSLYVIRRGQAQDVPFDLIIWYIAKKSCFLVIGPICDIELTCIFRPFFPFVSSIKDRSQYYKIILCINLFSIVFIITKNYVLYPILV